MTAKNVKGKSVAGDLYITPDWVVEELIEHVMSRVFPGGVRSILDPGSADGAFARNMRLAYPDATIVTVDINDRFHVDEADHHIVGDFCDPLVQAEALEKAGGRFDLAVGNPPFTLAKQFVEGGMAISRGVLFLLRHGFMASGDRAAWFRGHFRPSSVDNLPNRPKFLAGSGGDSADYCWIRWGEPAPANGVAEIHWMPTVPLARRKGDS